MKNNLFTDLIRLFFPPCCIACGNALSVGEECLCLPCLQELPKIRYNPAEANEIEKRFWGKIPVEHATSYFQYTKGSDFDKILFDLKYHGKKEIGEIMGRYMAKSLSDSNFFRDIDIIIPIPLHKNRYKKRGYNQSEWLAKGISEITQIPINTTSIKRVIPNSTQTHKNLWDRWEDVQNIFEIILPHEIQEKHILLVDDVLTTGATIISCATAIMKVQGVKISILTLAAA